MRINMSELDPKPAPLAPRVGADLRAGRERLGWDLPDVARFLRIRYAYLVALEEGRIDELPGVAYALGFLRTYASALGLDPDELARRFRDEARAIDRKPELVFPVPVPERGVPAGAVVLLAVILVVGAYVGWYRLSDTGALPPEVVPPVPTRLAPLAAQVMAPTNLQANATTPAAPQSASPAAPVSVASNQPASLPAGTAPSVGVSTPAPVSPAIAPEPAPSVPPSQAAAATMPPQSIRPPADQPRIVLSATADAWLLVRDKSGQVLLSRILHPGDSWSVPAQPNLTLTTGNAGGTVITVDGATTPPIGGDGVVRRDIPLDPDLLKAGKFGAVPTPLTTASSGTPVATKSIPQ
jgi:cytoskeleton protein RodZ